ncbi:MAG: SAM-dependent methyltransferase, partial [Blastochloris sp.]|nr:SAM-dependent methyltransferase [Blastochloris sp.]
SLALERTRALLEARGVVERVSLELCGHEDLAMRIPAPWVGRVGAVMFNLGYLPKGDHGWVTRAETTLPALEAACGVLRPGGILSVMLYHGHPGGREEMEAVLDWSEGKAEGSFERELREAEEVRAPRLLQLRKSF